MPVNYQDKNGIPCICFMLRKLYVPGRAVEQSAVTLLCITVQCFKQQVLTGSFLQNSNLHLLYYITRILSW